MALEGLDLGHGSKNFKADNEALAKEFKAMRGQGERMRKCFKTLCHWCIDVPKIERGDWLREQILNIPNHMGGGPLEVLPWTIDQRGEDHLPRYIGSSTKSV